MKAVVAAAMLLIPGVAHLPQPSADAPCTRQVVPNPSFERGATGWTAGPRMIVVGDATRPAHTGRAYATFGGLDVSRSEVLRTTVTIPAGCTLTLNLYSRATSSEGATSGDYLNVGLSVAGTPPKTIFPLTPSHGAGWVQRTTTWPAATTDRAATVSFAGSESAGGGTTAYDIDDVTITLG